MVKVKSNRSKAQRFASKRNWAKGIITGAVTALTGNVKKVSTKEEVEVISLSVEQLNKLLEDWDINYTQAKKERL